MRIVLLHYVVLIVDHCFLDFLFVLFTYIAVFHDQIHSDLIIQTLLFLLIFIFICFLLSLCLYFLFDSLSLLLEFLSINILSFIPHIQIPNIFLLTILHILLL